MMFLWLSIILSNSSNCFLISKLCPSTLLSALKETTNTDDKVLASKSYYNLANILRESGEMEESLEYYKKSIVLNPEDKDAKINYELLKQTLKQQFLHPPYHPLAQP